jgi:hypothetical protein
MGHPKPRCDLDFTLNGWATLRLVRKESPNELVAFVAATASQVQILAVVANIVIEESVKKRE